jgi:succinoglycan biosynthesis transport protein ExoP
MLEKTNKNVDFREYWQIFRRRIYFFIIPFVISIIVGIYLGVTAKPVYESSTVIQISDSQLLSNAMRKLVPGVSGPERLQNLRKLITSHSYLRRLIQTLNLSGDPNIREEAGKLKDQYPDFTIDEIAELLLIDILRTHIVIKPSGTNFIEVVAQAKSPDLAFNLTKTLTQIFIDESLRREVGGIRGALEFSSEQLALYKDKLEESEERLQKFQESVLDDEIENQAVIAANLDQMNTMIATIDFDLRKAKDRLNFLESRIRESGKNYKTPVSSELSRLKSRLLEAVLDLSKLMLKYSWQDARVLKVNSDIERLQENIRIEIEKEIKSQYASGDGFDIEIYVQKEIAAIDADYLNRKLTTLTDLNKLYKGSLSKAPSREMALDRLKREVAGNRDIYQALLQQTRGSEIEEALQKTEAEFRFKIVEPPTRPIDPIQPNRLRSLMIAIIMGAIIGSSFIFLMEYTDHSLKNVETVEKFLNLPVLGTVPHIEMELSSRN